MAFLVCVTSFLTQPRDRSFQPKAWKKIVKHTADANLGIVIFSTCGFASRPYKMPVMTKTIPQLFDPLAHRRNRQRAAATYANFAFLKDEAALRLADRVDLMRRDFDLCLDLGAHDGRL